MTIPLFQKLITTELILLLVVWLYGFVEIELDLSFQIRYYLAAACFVSLTGTILWGLWTI